MQRKAVLKELQAIDGQLANVRSQLGARRQKLLQEHLDEREHLLQRRFELVTGASAPTAEELSGYAGPQPADSKPQGVPCFWLNALSAEEQVGRHITAADRGALAYLHDVRYLRGAGGMLLEFHFAADNPYFENRVLRRGIGVEKDAQGNVVGVSDEGTHIEWYDGRSLLVRRTKVAGKKSKKKGGKGHKRRGKGKPGEDGEQDGEQEGEGLVRTKPVPSFFRFFAPVQKPKVMDPTALHDDEADGEDEEALHEEEEEQPVASTFEVDSDGDVAAVARDPRAQAAARKAERDVALLDVIVKRVIPRAVHLYLSAPQVSGGDASDLPPHRMSNDADDEGDGGASHSGIEAESSFEVVTSTAAAQHGGGEALSAAAQQALHALRGLQDQLDVLNLKFKLAKWEAAKQADVTEQQLLDKRAHLLRQGAQPLQSLHSRSAPAGGAGAALTSSVPLFWLAALRRCEASCGVVARRDEVALASLVDVRVTWDWAQPPTLEQPYRHTTVVWEFLDNPYFPACKLTKRYRLVCQGGSSSKLALPGAGEVVAGPQWLSHKPPHTQHGAADEQSDGVPGKCDLTLKGPSATGGNPPPATSFFNLFKKGSLRHAFAGLAEEHADAGSVLAAEEELLAALMGGPLRYTPTLLYQEVDIDEEDLGHECNEHEDDEEEGEGDEDEDEDGSDEDGGRARRRRPRASKQGGTSWGLSKQHVFMALMVLLALSQLVVYIETIFG